MLKGEGKECREFEVLCKLNGMCVGMRVRLPVRRLRLRLYGMYWRVHASESSMCMCLWYVERPGSRRNQELCAIGCRGYCNQM